jgi:transposase-like protein
MDEGVKARELEWQTRTDGCPKCGGSHYPTSIESESDSSLRLRYRCAKGHTWLTAWAKSVFDPRQPRH